MTEQELLEALKIGEGTDWEFKSAKGGLPGSMWETYSAMANTYGGMIGLGIEEQVGKFIVSGLPDAAKMKKNFWDTINNRGKVSANLLSDAQVNVVEVEGKSVLLVDVPRASRRERPVYVGQNPLEGTYRRNYEGDYLCRRDEVGRMLADQSEEAQDSRILEHFGIGDLDQTSIDQYRNRLSARSAVHPWLKLNPAEFLERLGAIRTDRESKSTGLTVAGLLMFGKDQAIRDPDGVPEFNLDFRERLSDDPAIRWTDRVWADGTWECNIFQFYERVVPRLTADLKIPFHFVPPSGGTTTTTPPPGAMQRQDDTIVHEAIREALVNSLIHADYRGQGGVIVERYRDRLEFSNPGTLVLSLDQILRGGVSECRNKTLQTMFSLLGYGEKAGSGFDKIRQGWASQHWRFPKIEETSRPDRVLVAMPMVSLLPNESVARLRRRFGPSVEALGPVEVQALVTADMEGSVNNPRLREICDEHPADLSKLLQGMVAKGFLAQTGHRRWSSYELAVRVDSPHSSTGTPHVTKDDSTHNGGGTPHAAPESDPALIAKAKPAREKKRLPPEEMKKVILTLCEGQFLSPRQVGVLVERNPQGIQDRYLRPMAKAGELVLRYPDEPNHPDQAYRTATTK